MDYSSLSQLMQGYFHESWPEDYGSDEAAIIHFCAEEPECVDDALSDLDLVLATTDDSDIERVLVEIGVAVGPDPGQSYREWLSKLADLIRRNRSAMR